MEQLFIFLIIFVLISRTISRLMEKASQQEERRKTFPLPSFTFPSEPSEITSLTAAEKKIDEPVEEIKKEKPLFFRVPPSEKTSPFPRTFSRKTLRKGIILSVILGPPKARQLRKFSRDER